MDRATLERLKRPQLQRLATANGVKGNMKSERIVAALLKKYPDGVPSSAPGSPAPTSVPQRVFRAPSRSLGPDLANRILPTPSYHPEGEIRPPNADSPEAGPSARSAQESISQVFGRIPQDHRNLLTEQASISDPLLGADNTGHTTHIESQSPREHVHHTHSATDDRPRNLRLPESDLRMITDLEISADRVVPPYPTEDSDPMPMEYMEQSVKVLRNIAIDHNDEWERLRVASEQAKAAMLSAENARRALMQERYMRERLEVQMAYSNNYTPEWPDRAIYRGTTEAKEYTTGFSEFSDYSEDSEDDGGEPLEHVAGEPVVMDVRELYNIEISPSPEPVSKKRSRGDSGIDEEDCDQSPLAAKRPRRAIPRQTNAPDAVNAVSDDDEGDVYSMLTSRGRATSQSSVAPAAHHGSRGSVLV